MTAERGPVAPAGGAGERGGRAERGDVVDGGPGQRQEGLEVEADLGGDALDLAEERDDVVRRDAGGGVVGGPVLVGDLDGAAAERGGDLMGDGHAGDGEGDTRAQPGGADLAVGQRDERVHGGPERVGAQGVEPEGAREVDDGRRDDRHDGGRHLGDGVVGRGDDEDVDPARRVRQVVAVGAGNRRIPSRAPRARRRGMCRPGQGR